MRAYNAAPRISNLGCAPAVPQLVWSYERRKAMSLERVRGKNPTPGRARRHGREWSARKYLRAIATWRRGVEPLRIDQLIIAPWRELIEHRIPNCPAWVDAMRAQARSLLGQAEKHGPASGWGVEQPEPTERQAGKWTPYWVPKASEKCWRWWRSVVRALARLLARLTRALASLVPAHRAHLEEPTPEKGADSSDAGEREALPRYRDKSTSNWLDVVARIGRRIGAPPSEGSQEAPIER